jgi:hypothetical protein
VTKKAAETKTVETKVAETKAAETKAAETKAVETKAAETHKTKSDVEVKYLGYKRNFIYTCPADNKVYDFTGGSCKVPVKTAEFMLNRYSNTFGV